jgi:hypothetical protein
MHLLERYSLACGGLTIDRPAISEKYFPMTIDKFITIHTTSKQSKTYDYFQEVVDLILPILVKNGIGIVQIGGKDETVLNGCYNTIGQTSMAQVAYITNKGLLHVGVDSFPVHFAGAFDKPVVALYSNNFINNVRPYWGDPNKQVLLEPDRKEHGKPKFTLEENPKTINTINPEVIAGHVCRLLGLEFDYPYKTVYVGSVYKNRSIEVVPDNVFNPQQVGLNAVVVRMDILFNEDILQQQLTVCPCCLVTNKAVSTGILTKFRQGINEVVYFVGPDNPPSVEFLKQLKNLKISYKILSDFPHHEMNHFKLDILDYGMILNRNWRVPDGIDLTNVNDYYYKSNKFLIGRGKIYQSDYDYSNDRPVPNLVAVQQKIIDNKSLDRLWKESEYCLFSKLDK